ncbi:MAG: hypothetical protein L6282_06715 [Candidatus Methanoperedenaceae archaeon]|nr:hypothetical protein [Candidatus Methanoperedenaceae archaeon]
MIKNVWKTNFLKYIFVISLVITGFYIGLLILFRDIFTDIILTLIAIDITIFIAWTQEKQLRNQEQQLNKLEDIGNHTKETTEKLKTDSIILSIIKKFFILRDLGKKYQLFFPVEYDVKPLPLINQGDFYAIHVVSSRIGEDNLYLETITKDTKFDKISIDGDAIFICAPHANPALKKIYDFKKIENDEAISKLENEKWPFEELDLPCWFVEDHRDYSRNAERKWKTRKIWVYDTKELLESPAENCYRAAYEKGKGKEFKCTTDIQQDYGILARVNKNDKQYIIIAGLHQYGTWIVASFLSNLLGGKNVDYKSTFLNENDFIAVIWGEYNNKKLAVNSESIGVYKKYIWMKESGKWVRIMEDKTIGVSRDLQ